VLLSYCIVNTNHRDLLLRCLEAVDRTAPTGVEREILVLDNASSDGSADAVRDRHVELIELDRRTGKAENDSTLLRRARGKYCLLLNEDAELCDGAPRTLIEALEADPGAAIAGSQLLAPDGTPQPCAWRFPSPRTAIAQALFLHRWLVVQRHAGPVDWVQSSAALVRREAAQEVGYLDPRFFVYSDETDFCKRLADHGWRTLLVPAARAVHREQLATDADAASRRIVEFHRNRDLYMRKHNGRRAAALVRGLTSWAYFVRALAAVILPGHDPRRYLLHARQALLPYRGEGIRDAAERQ
jgi:N-acetylglucosaminyl-diphospho-decaprenol L-rhamnosyltransferase